MRRFLIDNQLPQALVPWLESKGHRGEHVLALGLAQSSDEAIWLEAAATGSIILSKDEDFARFHLMRPEKVSVIWFRIGNCRTPALLAILERAWSGIETQLDLDARLIELQ